MICDLPYLQWLCVVCNFICTLDAFQTRILKQLTSILVENAGSVLSILSCVLTDKQRRSSIVDNFALELASELIQVPIERRTSPLQKTTRMLSFILNSWGDVIPWRTPGCCQRSNHREEIPWWPRFNILVYVIRYSDHTVSFFYIIKIPTPPKFVNPKAENWFATYLICSDYV